MMANSIASLNRLSMSYGKTNALHEVSLTIPEGELIGLAGANGSGKTTLLKLLAGMIQAYQGTIHVLNERDTWAAKGQICYHESYPYFQADQKIRDAIRMYNSLRINYDSNWAEETFKQFGYDLSARIGSLSKGRCALALLILSLSCEAKLYLLDEPFAGIDIKTRSEMKNVLLDRAAPGRTFLIATHELTDMESLFDRFILLDRGKIAVNDLADRLREEHGCSVTELVRGLL